jgi:hypothetical protein
VIAVEGFLFIAAMTPHLAIAAASTLGPTSRDDSAHAENETCRTALHRWIQQDRVAGLSGLASALVLTRPDDGPALLFWTDHRIVAWNHHRSSEGLTLLDRFFHARDDGELRSAIDAVGADLVLYCPNPSRAGNERYWRREDPAPLPAWLESLAGERTGSGPVLLRVSRETYAGGSR